MANLLGVDEECARRVVLKNEALKRLDESRIERTLDSLTQIGMSKVDIVEHPQILSYYPGFVDARYWSLVDFGLRPIKIPEILGYNSLIKKRSWELRRLELLSDNVEPFRHLLGKLSDLDTRFVSKYPDVENKPLLYMKKLILLEFLRQKLNCSQAEIVALVKKYPAIANRSVCSVRRSLNVLLDRFRFSVDKVKANGFMLTTNPCSAKRIADELSETMGRHRMREFVVKYPKILSIPVSRFLANNECLARFGITAEQILKGGAVYTLNSDTLRERLSELHSTDALKALMSSRRALSLVYSMNTAKRRLPYLASVGCNRPSLNALSSSRTDFVQLVSTRADRNAGKASISKLAKHLGRSREEISELLAVRPNRRGLSVENVPHVLRFLERRGFTAAQILNGLQVVLYELRVVQSYVGALASMEECRPFGHEQWQRDPFALQLLLYVIEKYNTAHQQAQFAANSSVQCDGTGSGEDGRDTNSPKMPELKYGRRVVAGSSDSAEEAVESFLLSRENQVPPPPN